MNPLRFLPGPGGLSRLLLSLILLGCTFPALAASRPNVLIILVDDMGFSDPGCYGGEIDTPNLDGLAKGGLRFTQFYNTARCWPTRGALLTGYYAQQIRRDVLPGIPSGGGNRGIRPRWAPLLPALLKSAGYRSYHSGKWHLDGMPVENGFDHSYYLLDQGRFFNPATHWQDDEKLPPVAKDSGYYGTIAIADHAVACLREHAEEYADQPFFHYLAFTAPHFPLHALPQDIAKYRGTYDVGWEVIRSRRWNRIREIGLVTTGLSEVEADVGPPYNFPEAFKILGPGEVNRPLPWPSLTTEQQRFQAVKMAIHAAMVDRVDQEIGRVLSQLRRMKALDNTLILFLSDNGASAEIMVRSDGHDPTAPAGSAASYLCLGPGGSTSSNTPFRRHKTWTHEGGIATSMIAHWPRGIADRGQFRTQPGHVVDLVPTVLELAGVMPPKEWKGMAVPEKPGRSLVPVLTQNASQPPRDLWWLHEENRAIRSGDWKLVAAKGDPWELYNLAEDRTETRDLAAEMPGKVKELETLWNRQLQQCTELALQDLPPARPGQRKPAGRGK